MQGGFLLLSSSLGQGEGTSHRASPQKKWKVSQFRFATRLVGATRLWSQGQSRANGAPARQQVSSSPNVSQVLAGCSPGRSDQSAKHGQVRLLIGWTWLAAQPRPIGYGYFGLRQQCPSLEAQFFLAQSVNDQIRAISKKLALASLT